MNDAPKYMHDYVSRLTTAIDDIAQDIEREHNVEIGLRGTMVALTTIIASAVKVTPPAYQRRVHDLLVHMLGKMLDTDTGARR